jgi:hypothetical protein
MNAQMRWFVGSNLITGFRFEFELVNMATLYLLRVGFVAQYSLIWLGRLVYVVVRPNVRFTQTNKQTKNQSS